MKFGLFRPTPDPDFCADCRTTWTMCSCDLDAEREMAFRRGARWRGPALGLLAAILFFMLYIIAGWHRIQERTAIYAEILRIQKGVHQ